MDPDDVIILASPQHPIKAMRIKYYEDPKFMRRRVNRRHIHRSSGRKLGTGGNRKLGPTNRGLKIVTVRGLNSKLHDQHYELNLPAK